MKSYKKFPNFFLRNFIIHIYWCYNRNWFIILLTYIKAIINNWNFGGKWKSSIAGYKEQRQNK